jgi:hypothetical protein
MDSPYNKPGSDVLFFGPYPFDVMPRLVPLLSG